MMLNDRFCNLLESCGTPEAPLCPLQEPFLKTAVWYGDEPICQSENFQNVSWIKKQKMISELGLTAEDGFFTVGMLKILRTISQNIKGANPDDANAETKWLKQHEIKLKSKRVKKAESKNSIKPISARLF